MPGFARRQQQGANRVLADDGGAVNRADQVITRRAFAHAFGQYLADDVAGRDAKAGIALHEKRIAAPRQGAHLREQVRAARHWAAPGQVDFHVLEVGENLQHQLAVPGFQIAWNVLHQRRGGAEEQAVFVGHAVVVDHRADIAVGPTDRADALDQLLGQRLGHHLERVGVDGRTVQFRLQLVEEAVTGPQQLAGAYRTATGAHGDALAIADFQGRAVFEDLHTMADQRGGFAQQQVQ